MISKTCEDISGFFDAKDDDAKALAYKNCLTGPGSTYQADMGGCLSCKRFNAYLSPGQNTFWVEAQKKAWEAFKQDKLPTDSYWQYSLRFLPWDQYPNDPKGFKASNTSIEHYYPFAPESQSIGIVNRRQGKRALPSADEPRVVLIWEKGSVVGAYVDNKL
ncbi:hypothetical protein RJ55_07335 [Drechmeria coniospora]|nr:hypothetical protein RJ55_07335 [Drechmeria coniospora]